jgi:hypothetical protein
MIGIMMTSKDDDNDSDSDDDNNDSDNSDDDNSDGDRCDDGYHKDESKYDELDEFYGITDISDGDGFEKLIERLTYS